MNNNAAIQSAEWWAAALYVVPGWLSRSFNVDRPLPIRDWRDCFCLPDLFKSFFYHLPLSLVAPMQTIVGPKWRVQQLSCEQDTDVVFATAMTGQ